MTFTLCFQAKQKGNKKPFLATRFGVDEDSD